MIVTHIHNLRPFNYDEGRTDPVAVAQQNAQEFAVEEVLAHRGDRAKRSTLEFLGALQEPDACRASSSVSSCASDADSMGYPDDNRFFRVEPSVLTFQLHLTS